MLRTSADQLWESWEHLELELLVPSPLFHSKLEIIDELRREPRNARNLEAFCSLLPLEVATIRDEWEDDLLRWARQQDEYKSPASDPYERNLVRAATAFKYDITRINESLFGHSGEDHSPKTVRCVGGYFNRTLAPDLHVDQAYGACTDVVYSMRLGALPTWFVDDSSRRNASKYEKKLLDAAAWHNEEGARDKLKALGLLQSFDLGKVALFATGPHGTLHCSSNSDVRDPYSIFFHTRRDLESAPPMARKTQAFAL